MPTLSSLLDPALRDTDAIFSKEKGRKSADAEGFNKHRRARKLSTLQPGEEVWVSDAKESETIVASHFAPQYYLVNTQQENIKVVQKISPWIHSLSHTLSLRNQRSRIFLILCLHLELGVGDGLWKPKVRLNL